MLEIPMNIKNLIDYDFCKAMIYELHMIWGISIQDFGCSSIANMENSIGWIQAFLSSCRKTSKGTLYQYYNTLTWYDEEMFDAYIVSAIIEHKLILPSNEVDAYSEMFSKDKKDIIFCNQIRDFTFREKCNESGCDLSKLNGQICFCINTNNLPSKINIDFDDYIQKQLGLQLNHDYFICEVCGKRYLNNCKTNNKCKFCYLKENHNEKGYWQEEEELNNEFKKYLNI